MIRQWVYIQLVKRLDKKKYKVLELQWEKVRLEKKLEQLKNQA